MMYEFVIHGKKKIIFQYSSIKADNLYEYMYCSYANKCPLSNKRSLPLFTEEKSSNTCSLPELPSRCIKISEFFAKILVPRMSLSKRNADLAFIRINMITSYVTFDQNFKKFHPTNIK